LLFPRSDLQFDEEIAHLHWRAAQVLGENQERPCNDMIIKGEYKCNIELLEELVGR